MLPALRVRIWVRDRAIAKAQQQRIEVLDDEHTVAFVEAG
jgi:hypothetical protein